MHVYKLLYIISKFYSCAVCIQFMQALHYPATIPWVARCIELDHGGISFQLQHVSNQRPPREGLNLGESSTGLAGRKSQDFPCNFCMVEMPTIQDTSWSSWSFPMFSIIASFHGSSGSPNGKSRNPRNPTLVTCRDATLELQAPQTTPSWPVPAGSHLPGWPPEVGASPCLNRLNPVSNCSMSAEGKLDRKLYRKPLCLFPWIMGGSLQVFPSTNLGT
jgi:hypothetical protein